MPSDYADRSLTVRTWHVTRTQAQEIAEIADGLGVGRSRLVRYLLAFALAEVRAGRLILRTEPSAWRLLDYAGDG
jgi:hypothetical protein